MSIKAAVAKSIRITLAASALLALAGAGVGCKKEKLAVRVECSAPSPAAIECQVAQTTGKSEMEACWDLRAECPNGAVVTAPRTCQKVKDGGTATASIPADTMENVDQCGGGQPKVTIANLTINGKKAN